MYSDMTNPSKLTTNKLFKGLDAPACLLKARAIASDAHGKLDAAKGKYLEAVGMVEGDSIFDPDGTSRKVATQKAPCGIVQAGMVELKVTSYTAIALCCKLVQVIDGLPVVVASKNGKLPKGPESNADKMKLERALRVRVELVSDIVASVSAPHPWWGTSSPPRRASETKSYARSKNRRTTASSSSSVSCDRRWVPSKKK